MTILTAGACGFLVTTSGGVVPAAVGTAAGVLVTGAKLWIYSEPAKVAVSTAVGTGISSGAIAGSIVSKTFAGTASGALIGCCSSGGVGSVLAGSLAAAGGSVAGNPVGLLTVGTSCNDSQVKFDCWKPVVHDVTKVPSNGMLLRDLVAHQNVGKVTVTPGDLLPKIELQNIWGENFEIEYVLLDDCNKLYCHANIVN